MKLATTNAALEENQMTVARNADFSLLWSGQIVSRLGSALSTVVVPLLAVTALGAKPFQMGILSAVGAIPLLVLSIAAGILADRLRKRTIMLTTNCIQA